MSALELFFLGAPEYRRNGVPVSLAPAKATALLAYLALTRTPHPREHLADLLWPDSLPDAARKNLRNTLWAIRRNLGDDIIHTDGEQVGLSPALWMDLHHFEALSGELTAPGLDVNWLENRLALYRGPFLEGLSTADAPEFELWLVAERERLQLLYLRGLEKLIDLHRQAGDWPAVVSVARRALGIDNLREPVYRALIEALARQGNRGEAARQYQRLRDLLAQELSVAPLPETEALYQAVLNGSLPDTPAPVSGR
ncbi:MAG: hypothetical protein D6784_05375, partial [Chloroflexi bacterium]